VPTRRFAWEGSLRPGAAVTFTYRVTVAEGSPVGAPAIINVARLGLEGQGIHFRRSAVVQVGAPDLSPSAFQCGLPPDRPGAVVTCTLGLANAGTGDAPGVLVTNPLPADAALVPGSLARVGGGVAEALTGTVRWAGPLSGGARVTLTYQLTLPTNLVHPPVYNAAFLEDGVGGAWERQVWLLLEPYRSYLPVVMRKG
jgi:uncharacterized repeat protein (TIGR01451 family)